MKKQLSLKHPNMIRSNIYTIEEVLSKRLPTKTPKKESIVLFSGVPTAMNSQRYQVFFEKGCVCVKCGLKGSFFAQEKHNDSSTKLYHFNLYAINNDGEEVLMTKDHIIPKSLGGRNHISNYQTMCAVCNSEKGNGKNK